MDTSLRSVWQKISQYDKTSQYGKFMQYDGLKKDLNPFKVQKTSYFNFII